MFKHPHTLSPPQFEQLATNPRAKSTSDKGSNGKMITWSDPNQLEAYVHQLHTAAERLTQENRKLRQVHHAIGDKVTPPSLSRLSSNLHLLACSNHFIEVYPRLCNAILRVRSPLFPFLA